MKSYESPIVFNKCTYVLQEEVDCDMECDTLPQTVSNGHLPVYHYSSRYVYIKCATFRIHLHKFFLYKLFFLVFCSGSDHHEQSFCPPDDSTLQLLDSSHQHLSSQELGGDGDFCGGDKAEDGITHSMSTVNLN